MLVITRKALKKGPDGEVVGPERTSQIVLCNNSEQEVTITLQPGESLGTITVIRQDGNNIGIGLEFPMAVGILRGELSQHVKQPSL